MRPSAISQVQRVYSSTRLGKYHLTPGLQCTVSRSDPRKYHPKRRPITESHYTTSTCHITSNFSVITNSRLQAKFSEPTLVRSGEVPQHLQPEAPVQFHLALFGRRNPPVAPQSPSHGSVPSFPCGPTWLSGPWPAINNCHQRRRPQVATSDLGHLQIAIHGLFYLVHKTWVQKVVAEVFPPQVWLRLLPCTRHTYLCSFDATEGKNMKKICKNITVHLSASQARNGVGELQYLVKWSTSVEQNGG